jgi:hypothetical protein
MPSLFELGNGLDCFFWALFQGKPNTFVCFAPVTVGTRTKGGKSRESSGEMTENVGYKENHEQTNTFLNVPTVRPRI